jgi:epsin
MRKFNVRLRSRIVPLLNFLLFSFNQAKPKTEVEARVYEVLSHKNWGASSSLMNDIARDTFDYDKFAVISQIVWESLENQRPAAWRLVFKGLTLLEHLVKNGSERCVDDARNHGHTLRALHQFNYYEGTTDRGVGVREKSKQLVDLLSSDDAVREERMKARKLREKFGGKMGGVSSSGATTSMGGYANDSWDGGYGEGGIGAGSTAVRAGGGPSSTAAPNSSYSGRYNNDETTRQPSSNPTFAGTPDRKVKGGTKKTKKKAATDMEPTIAAIPPAAPAVDLFSFDDPSPAPAASGGDDFADFQSAGGATNTSNQFNTMADPFAAPLSSASTIPMVAPPQQKAQSFDVFGSSPVASTPSIPFDAFGTAASQPQSFGAFGGGLNSSATPAMGMNNRNNGAFGSISAGDDDFGDFSGASATSSFPNSNKMAPSKAAGGAPASSDPLSKLISLDGLSKNTGKTEDKLNQPIIATPAAAQFLQEKATIESTMQQAKKGSSMAFSGLDGLNHGMSTMSMGMSNPSIPPLSSTIPGGVMGGAGGMNAFNSNTSAMAGGADISSMFDPTLLNANKPSMAMNNISMGGMNNMGAMGNMNASTGMNNMSGGMMPGAMNMGGAGMMQGGMGVGGMGNMGMMQGGPMGGNMMANNSNMTPQQQQQMMQMMMMQQQMNNSNSMSASGGMNSFR